MIEKKAYSILELNNIIKELVRGRFPDLIWVCGEIQDLRERNGHTYFNFVQKDAHASRILAQANAVIFRNVRPFIEKTIKESGSSFELKKDIEVKFLCRVDFYSPRGQYSLIVDGIDPIYTMGKMARARQKTIERLSRERLLARNKSICLSPLPLKIGLISAIDSAAYNDFVTELRSAGYGFKIYIYDCHMQGPKTEEDVAAALRYFSNLPGASLDALVITRGGGSTADLSWFDSERIARAAALSKFAVISGLGHEINFTITDMVAHTSVKTPTAAAQFLVERVRRFCDILDTTAEKAQAAVHRRLQYEKEKIETAFSKIRILPSHCFSRQQRILSEKQEKILTRLRRLSDERVYLSGALARLSTRVPMLFALKRADLGHLQHKLELLNPKNILRRGYTITYKNKRALKTAANLSRGQLLTTVFYEGNIVSEVKE